MRTRICAVLLVLVALALAGCTTRVVTAGPTADTVTVTGSGSALSKPDRATVRFGVVARDADPRKAMSQASAASNKLVAALGKAGIAKNDLQTGSVRLEPQYSYTGGRQRLTGYAASFDVSAKTRKLDSVGDVIVAGTQAGATNVAGITFDLDDSNPARYDASAKAVEDARSRAAAMAKAAGRSLGSVIAMGEPQATGGSDYRVNYTSALLRSPMSVPDIQPGQLTAGESVQVTFALK